MNERDEDMTPEEFDAAMAKGEPVEIHTPPEGIRFVMLPEVPPGVTMDCGDGYIYTSHGRTPKHATMTAAFTYPPSPDNPYAR